jgi:hypothetical protein
MSTATAIGLVSESLRELLLVGMQVTPKPKVTILAPDESADEPRINLFLYKIQENPALRNMDWQVKPGYPNQLMPPPLSLNLFYLMTPYTAKSGDDGNTFAHAILGDAMRVFYEHPIIPRDRLSAGLESAREQIRILLSPVDLDELSRVWSTFTQPYRLSVMYEVSVVQLDMLADSERPMATRVRQIGVPDVRAPYRPPAVHQLEPASGPAGTTVTVVGENLAGRSAYVRVMGRQILEASDLADDMFEATLPDDLPPGFHEIQVDISHLCRRTFFFEVVP